MSPSAEVVAYMINPNNEVSADSLPFDVEFNTPVDSVFGF
jgi:CD109 antigen